MKPNKKFNTSEYVMELQYRYYSCLEELHLNRNQISNHAKEKDELLRDNMDYYQNELDKKESIIKDNKNIMDSYKKSKARYSKANKDLKKDLRGTLGELAELEAELFSARTTLQEVIDDRNKIIIELEYALKLYTPEGDKGVKLKCKPVVALNVKEFKRLQDKLRNDNTLEDE